MRDSLGETDATVILCSRNRAQSLAVTLPSVITAVQHATCRTELLVIDNGSTDETSEVCRQTLVGLSNARLLREERTGKGFAYNTGIQNARGGILLFTDDDVQVPLNWVDQVVARLQDISLGALAGGVRLWERAVRPWMLPIHRMWLASTETLNPASPEFLVGANMAITRNVFERIGGFDPELGPGALGYCDETLLSLQLREAGIPIVGGLDIVVEHCVDPSRISREAFVKRAAAEGRCLAYIAYHWEHRAIPRPRLKLTKRLLMWWFRSAETPAGDEPELELVRDIAFLRQYLKESRRPRNYDRRGLVKIRGVR